MARITQVVAFFLGILLLAVVGMFFVTDGDYSVPDTVATDSTIPHIEIDGVVFHVATYGNPNKPVVVIVHGGPGGNFGYLLNLHKLEDDYFVVFYDQRGAGLSPRVDTSELSLDSSIADLHRIVTYYGKGQPVRLVGHSWGAILSAAYIGEYPESVEQVVLAEPAELTHATPKAHQERMSASQGFGYYAVLLPTVFETFHMEPQDEHAITDYIGLRMATAFVRSSASGYTCAKETVVTKPDVHVPPSRLGAAAYNALFNETVDLSQIQRNAHNYVDEVLFIASECSAYTGVALQRSQMGIFPRARLAIVPSAGHEMFSDNPTDSLAAVREYFASSTE